MNPSKQISEYLASIGRKGGKKSSAAKRRANREKMRRFWADVRAGIRKKPDHKPKAKEG